jgi:hypothetical protein
MVRDVLPYAADGLTEEEIKELRRMYNEIISATSGQLDKLENATGIDLQDTILSASQKGIASISQDSADALEGKFTTMLYYQDKIHTTMFEIRVIVASMLTLMGEIAVNTAYCWRLETMERFGNKMRFFIITLFFNTLLIHLSSLGNALETSEILSSALFCLTSNNAQQR